MLWVYDLLDVIAVAAYKSSAPDVSGVSELYSSGYKFKILCLWIESEIRSAYRKKWIPSV